MVLPIRTLAVVLLLSGGSALGQMRPEPYYPSVVWPVQPATRPKVVEPSRPAQVIPPQYPVQRPMQVAPPQYPVQRPIQATQPQPYVQRPAQVPQQYAVQSPRQIPQSQYPVQRPVQMQPSPHAQVSRPPEEESPMYDHSFGVTQPYATYSVVQRRPQPQTGRAGLMGDIYATGTEIREYVQGYLPAPLREGPSPYTVPPGSGVVSEVYVPGSQ
jgi:hypothetical protein